MIEQTLVALIKFRAAQERLSGKENVDYRLIVYLALFSSWTITLVGLGIVLVKLYYINPFIVLFGCLFVAATLAMIHTKKVLKSDKVEKLRKELFEAEEIQVKKDYKYGLMILGTYISIPFFVALIAWSCDYYYYS